MFVIEDSQGMLFAGTEIEMIAKFNDIVAGKVRVPRPENTIRLIEIIGEFNV